MTDNKPNQGWECPKCGRVYAPWVMQCDKCPIADMASSPTANDWRIVRSTSLADAPDVGNLISIGSTIKG